MHDAHYANPDGLHGLPGVITHVVTVPELGLVYTSTQVAWDEDGNLVGEGDYAEQAEQIVRNLDIALASVGATRDDLIKQTILLAGQPLLHKPASIFPASKIVRHR